MSSPITEVKPSQVAQLMKENAKLKEENENKKTIMDIDSFIDELEKVCECHFTGYMKCLEKVKELKAENEKLQNDFQKGYDEGREEYQVDKEYLDEKDDEIEKLKAENEKLKNKTLDNPQKSFDAMCKVVVELQEQIKTLKEENDRLEQFHKWDKIGAIKLGEAKEEIEKLKEENDNNEVGFSCLRAEKEFIDPKGKYTWVEDYDGFNNYLKENYNDDMYKKMYDWFDMDEMLGLNEEGLTTIMYEGKEYYLDMPDVYDTSHEIVGKWEMGEIVFNEDEDDKQKMDINELKKHFNNIIYLVKGCDTDEKLQKLKELNTLD